MASPDASKLRCPYWDTCYRKNPTHRTDFLHPGDVSSGDGVKDGTEDEAKKKNPVVGARIDLRKKRVIFSGSFSSHTRPQMVARAKMFGCVIQTSLGRDTDAVVCGSTPGKIAEDAKLRGVKVYSEEDWETVLLQAKPVRGYKASRRNKDAMVCSDSDDEDYEPGTRKRKMPAARRKRVRGVGDVMGDVFTHNLRHRQHFTGTVYAIFHRKA